MGKDHLGFPKRGVVPRGAWWSACVRRKRDRLIFRQRIHHGDLGHPKEIKGASVVRQRQIGRNVLVHPRV